MKVCNAFDKTFPVEVYFCNIQSCGGANFFVPCIGSVNGWGVPSIEFNIKEEIVFPPEICRCIYLSVIDEKIYQFNNVIKRNLNECYTRLQNLLIEDDNEITLVVGCAPFGGIAFWLYSLRKSLLLSWQHGEECNTDINIFKEGNCQLSLSRYCRSLKNYLNISFDPFSLDENAMELQMKQYVYRYTIVNIESNETPDDISYSIEDTLYDGTHDKLNNGHLMAYHSAGMPKKIKVRVHGSQTEILIFLWLDMNVFLRFFERFYGAHPDTKTDFIIKIDTEKKKYELALYRQGLKEPVVIPESAYQLIVFKNKFEDYRSENYNQPRGAWIW